MRGFTCPALLGIPLGHFEISHTGLSPSTANLSRSFCCPSVYHIAVPQPLNNLRRQGLGCSPFARRYLGNKCLFLFLGLLRCFSSPGFASGAYVFSARYPDITLDGLPHSEILGLKHVCGSPRLIAAYHVLHRLSMPSHPP